MSHFLRALLTLALANAALVPGTARAQDRVSLATPVAAASFAFAWPVPCSVQVIKVGEKRGQQAKLRYRLDVQAGNAGELRLRHSAFEFLEIAHKDATTPEMKEMLASALAMTEAVPDIIVSKVGTYLRVDGIDAMIKRMGEAGGIPEAKRERMQNAMRSPAMLDTLQQALGADWHGWVGAWVGFDLAPQQESVTEGLVSAFGESLPAKVTRRHHGDVAQHPGHVRLSVTSIAEGEAVTRAMAAIMTRIAKENGESPFPADSLVSIRNETVAEVVIDPKTLKPLTATRVKTVRVVTKGELPRDQVERTEFTFAFEVVPAQK